MKLRLERSPSAHGCTIGELFVDGAPEAFTLEDEVREVEGQPVSEWKIDDSTAIPRGVYPVTITYSNRFKRDLPLIDNVPGFAGIRIHPGNSSEDTSGCILVGRSRTLKSVTESKVAFNALYAKIEQGLAAGDVVTLEIV